MTIKFSIDDEVSGFNPNHLYLTSTATTTATPEWAVSTTPTGKVEAGFLDNWLSYTDAQLSAPTGMFTNGAVMSQKAPKAPLPVAPPMPELPPPPVAPSPPADSTVFTVAGITVTAGQIREAIAALQSAKGNSVTVPLARLQHPLLAVNWLGIRARVRAWSRPQDRPVGKRDTVLCFLHTLIDPLAAGPLRRDPDTGYVIPVSTDLSPIASSQVREAMRAIAALVGNGRIVARPITAMPLDDCGDWLTRWYAGDLRGCYMLESRWGHPSIHHPGHPDQPATHRIIWAPAVPGETPAGADVPGDWPAPYRLDGAATGAYLLMARAQHPEQLSHAERSRWVRAHLSGDKASVDIISLRALQRHTDGTAPRDGSLIWVQPPAQADWQVWAQCKDHCENWPMRALRDYATHEGLATEPLWSHQVRLVQAHRDKVRRDEMVAGCRLRLHADPDQPSLTGYHRKQLLRDQHGRRWLFKKAPDGQPFRAETEDAAHRLARAWGYHTVESSLITFAGEFGQLQALLPVKTNLLGISGSDFAALSLAQLCAIAREHVLDWALDNDDTHGENIVVCADGAIIGIDKGRAWRYFGGWHGLVPDQRADSNCQTVYVALYTAIAEHLLDQSTAQALYRSVIGQARRMQRLPDDVLARFVLDAVAHRPHFQPSSYQSPVAGAPSTAEELLDAAVHRKNHLVADMQLLWSRIFRLAGWDTPGPDPTALPDNPQGHQLHTGLHHPDLHAAVLATKSYGTATFVAGTDVEDGHVLLWRERHPKTTSYAIRGHLKARGPVIATLDQWCKQHTNTDTAAPPPSTLPGESAFYQAIINAAKTVSHHCEDEQYNPQKMYDVTVAAESLRRILTDAAGWVNPDHTRVALVDMATRYLGYIATITRHRVNHTKSQEGDFPRFVYTPPEPPTPTPPAPDAVAVALVKAERPAAHQDGTVLLAPDGELGLDGTALRHHCGKGCMGQYGDMYRITLPAGETLEYRSYATGTRLALVGQIQFTIPEATSISQGLQRIDAQLATMGLNLRPATPVDLELFYWRHLAGVMSDRADSRTGAGKDKYRAFWTATPDATHQCAEAQQHSYRAAFTTLVGAPRVTEFLAAGHHLPRFMHFDVRHPTQPGGHPYWNRIDVSDEQWRKAPMPGLIYRSGPTPVLATGMAASTEARIRHFAIWKPGQSSAEDMSHGSSSFVFTRQNNGGGGWATLWLSPRVLTRTHNYAFNDDKYGRISERPAESPFDFAKMTSFTDHGNELLIKHAVSLLDDVEIVVFEQELERDTAVANLHAMGIQQIRGVPVEVRFIVHQDTAARRQAVQAARVSYHQDW